MAKRGRVSASLKGLKNFMEAMTIMRKSRVDIGFFAGDAARSETEKQAAKKKALLDIYTGAGSKPGFYHEGIRYKNNYEEVKNFKKDEGITNPELAAKHEFGIDVPRRSMLRMPMNLHGDEVVKKARSEVQVSIKDIGKRPGVVAKKILRRMGIGAEAVVQEAFATRGFGQWKANAPVTIALKGSDSPLIDTAQLRRAVDSRVVSA